MDAFQLAFEDTLIICAAGVVETFREGLTESKRTPVAWLGVNVEARKHDRIRVKIGRAKDRGGPVYGPGVEVTWTDAIFDAAAADEPSLRAFFERAAQVAERAAF